MKFLEYQEDQTDIAYEPTATDLAHERKQQLISLEEEKNRLFRLAAILTGSVQAHVLFEAEELKYELHMLKA